MPPVVLGVDFDAEPSTGIGSARKRKPGWRQRVDQAAALAIGAGVVIVRAELLHRSAPGALLIETRPVAAPAKATRPRWTAGQQARRLRAAPDAPAPPAKPARTRHGGRGRAA